ncbi:MAG: hypothetical protein U0263_40800 [Polyangiaceae bacterium]
MTDARHRRRHTYHRPMACPVCGTITATARANTGRGEYFGDPITRMTRYDLESSDDFWECPECSAVFVWHDDTSFTGSGNNDEETLTRVGLEEAAAIRTLAHRAAELDDRELEALGEGIAETPPPIRDLVVTLVRRDMKTAQRLIPGWVARAGQSPWLVDLLERLVTTPDEAACVRAALEPHEGAHLEPLRRHVRTVGCSICRVIPYYPPLEASRAPGLGGMRQLGQGRHDLRECPECGSLFSVEGAGATRVPEALAQALRECFHATVASPAALSTVRNCGATWKWVGELVEQRSKPRQLVPTEPDDSLALRREIALHPDDLSLRQRWAELAESRDPDRARLVREQLARRTKQLSSPGYRAFVSASEQALLEAHPEWSDELAPLGVAKGALLGGFVESIVIDAATLLARGSELYAFAPVRKVGLTGDVALVAQLAKDGLLDRICWLDLSGLRIDAEVLASLAPLPRLRALGLVHCGVTDSLVEILWQAFPRLHVCELARNLCTDLVDKDLTWQEMSRYEWFATKHAAELAARYGTRPWIYPSSSPGETPSISSSSWLGSRTAGERRCAPLQARATLDSNAHPGDKPRMRTARTLAVLALVATTSCDRKAEQAPHPGPP